MPQHTYLIAHPDGRFERIQREAPILIDDLRQILSGPPEHVVITDRICAYCHEMGRLEGQPSNRAYPNMPGTLVFCREDPRGFYCGFGLDESDIEAIEKHQFRRATIYASPVQTIQNFRPQLYTGEEAIAKLQEDPIKEIIVIRQGLIAVIEGEIATVTGPDAVSGELIEVGVPADGLKRWLAGELIQNAMPDAPREVREFLLSGTSPATWNRMFRPDIQREARH